MAHGSTYAEVTLALPAPEEFPDSTLETIPIAVFGAHAGINAVDEEMAEFGPREPFAVLAKARPPIALFGKELHEIRVDNPNITAYTIHTPAPVRSTVGRGEDRDSSLLQANPYAGLFDRFAFGFARHVDEHAPEKLHSGISTATMVVVKGALGAFDTTRRVREKVVQTLTE